MNIADLVSPSALLAYGVSALGAAIGYWKTIGAKRERARIANLEIEKVLLKRLILDDFPVSTNDIEALRSGKSLEHRARIAAILPASDLLSILRARVLENDFISKDRRQSVHKMLVDLAEKTRAEPPIEQDDEETTIPARRIVGFVALGLLTVVSGGLSAVILSQVFNGGLTYGTLLQILAVEIAIVLGVLLFFLSQDRDSPSNTSQAQGAVFEERIRRALKRAGGHVTHQTAGGADFSVRIGNSTTVVEALRMRRPSRLRVEAAAVRASQAMQVEGAERAILVVNRFEPWMTDAGKRFGVTVVPISGLNRELPRA